MEETSEADEVTEEKNEVAEVEAAAMDAKAGETEEEVVSESVENAPEENTESEDSASEEIQDADAVSAAPFDETATVEGTGGNDVKQAEIPVAEDKVDEADAVEASLPADKRASIDDALALELNGDCSDGEDSDSLISM